MALLLLHLPTLALNAVTTLVYPLYSSYKAVTDSSTSLAQMEVWLVYWSVYACWTLFESLFGFLWSWIPFYYELRLLFNLWLVAPQTRGATYIYVNHLHPFLQSNQTQIDSIVSDAKHTLKARAEELLGGMWNFGASSSDAAAPPPMAGKGNARHQPPGPGPLGNAPAPPTQHNPAQAPLSLLGGLVKQYAPIAIAGAKSLFDSSGNASLAAYSVPPSGPSSSSSAAATAAAGPLDERKRQEAANRRRELERQLAALDASGAASSSSSSSGDESGEVPVTVMGNPAPSRATPASLRQRTLGARMTVKNNLGESYDLLDQADVPPSSPAPANHLDPNRGSPLPRPRSSWIPWSPSPNPNLSSPATNQRSTSGPPVPGKPFKRN
ncbi:hypothetical protein BCV70DRAFT_202207 [Testicularia cyperi]|uniref:Protein YOP1 n=1 Tax=Testicularia cyperi TaxID=1882483 RepID=A0A317XIC0_9BASI|nr:hypothetical protein BCV70DRAFT_202207 [Testicularia cyperi]